MKKQIIVIGGGPAGIEAAATAAAAKAQVTLISDGPIGGRAGWHSLVPSKVWLTAAEAIGSVADSPFLDNEPAQYNVTAILNQIKVVTERWNRYNKERLQSLGVEIVTGTATFEAPGRLAVTHEETDQPTGLEGEAIIIATGSVPLFPPQLRPGGRRVLAPRFAGHLESLPDSIIVIGAGPTGCEFTYLFNRLGLQVTWVVDPYGVLPTFAPAAGYFLNGVLMQRGVKVVSDQFAVRIERVTGGVVVVTSNEEHHRAEMAFVAIGRQPDLERLNLETVGLIPAPRQPLATDEYGQTTVPGLYVVGDAAGAPMVANRAMAQARVAARHAAGVKTRPFQPNTVVYAVYTEPEVAQVGRIEGPDIQTTHLPFNTGLKAHLSPGEEEGFLRLAYTRHGQVTGAVAAGPQAAEVLAPIALAIQTQATLDDLAALYSAHPTMSEFAFIAARLAG